MTEVFIGTDYWQNITATWGDVTFPSTWDGLPAFVELTINAPTYTEASIASTSLVKQVLTYLRIQNKVLHQQAILR